MTKNIAHDDNCGETPDSSCRTDEQREIVDRATRRFQDLQIEIESLTPNAWMRPRPWWLLGLDSALAAACAAGLLWAWFQHGWWWLMPTIVTGTFLVGFLIHLFAPDSVAQKRFVDRLEAEVNELSAEMEKVRCRDD